MLPACNRPLVDWGVASRAKPGETLSGDLAEVRMNETHCVAAVVDGLGHGAQAAEAAELVATLIRRGEDDSPSRLLTLAHGSLAGKRGATATVACIDLARGELTWLGVGDVNGILVRADGDARPRTLGAFLGRGVLGHQMPRLRPPEPLPLEPGDSLVLHTDGVRGDVTALLHPTHPLQSVQRVADAILAQGAFPNDDALVLVLRYCRPGAPS